MPERDRARLDDILNEVEASLEDLLEGRDLPSLLKDLKDLPPDLAREIRESLSEDPEVKALLAASSREAEIEVRISDDGTEAVLEARPPMGLAEPPGADAVRAAIEKAGVVAGLLEGKVEEVARALARGEIAKAVVARATPPVPGADGACEWTKTASEGYDGDAVEPGDVLGVVSPPGEGTPGRGVDGRELPASRGKPFAAVWGEGVEFRPRDGGAGEVVATKGGMFRIREKDGRTECFVDDVRRIRGDVNAIVGDVSFPGSVIVEGDIQRGRVVEARRGILVKGTIEGAIVRSEDGDVVVEQGIQMGGSGVVSSGRDVVAKFIENATIYAGRDVCVRGAVLHSQLTVGRRVVAKGKRAVVIGGTIRARDGLEAREVGAMGARTKVFFGISLEDVASLEGIDARLRRLEEISRRVDQAMAVLLKDREATALSDDERRIYRDLKKKKLVLALDEKRTREAKEEILERATHERRGELVCHDVLHPGVRVRFGDVVFDNRKEERAVRLRLSRDGRVEFAPLFAGEETG